MKWITNINNAIIWSEESRLVLVKFIKNNLAILDPDGAIGSKEMAWQKVYKEMEKCGMPDSSLGALKSTWKRIRNKAKISIERWRKQKSNRNKSILPLTPTELAVQDLFDYYRRVSKKAKTPSKVSDSKPKFRPSAVSKVRSTWIFWITIGSFENFSTLLRVIKWS